MNRVFALCRMLQKCEENLLPALVKIVFPGLSAVSDTTHIDMKLLASVCFFVCLSCPAAWHGSLLRGVKERLL